MHNLSFIAAKKETLGWLRSLDKPVQSSNVQLQSMLNHTLPPQLEEEFLPTQTIVQQSIVYAIPCQKLLEVSANLLYIYEVKRPIYYIFYLKYLYKHSGTRPQLTLFGVLERIQGACFGCWHSVVKNAQLYFGKKKTRGTTI